MVADTPGKHPDEIALEQRSLIDAAERVAEAAVPLAPDVACRTLIELGLVAGFAHVDAVIDVARAEYGDEFEEGEEINANADAAFQLDLALGLRYGARGLRSEPAVPR